jgi:hypothetical protein
MSRKGSETWGTHSFEKGKKNAESLGHPSTLHSSGESTNFRHQDIGVVDFDRADLSAEIPAEAAPFPFLRRIDQPARDRIAMNVSQLLDSLLLGPDVEVVKSRLPKMTGSRCRIP